MINRISYLTTENTVPYENLALEELLMQESDPDECILYLWQNRHTVVIGRNQNCRGECRIGDLEKDGGYLARRLSGGGAVFHDMGNLNFTFLIHTLNYDLDRQLGVIVGGVQAMGIAAEKSGRNDITAHGKKFSGNAFYHSGGRSYHHGTIMVDADLDNLSHYLTVSPDKLAANGVQSVRSRVVNLRELNPAVTVEGMKSALITSFGEQYGLTPAPFDPGRIDSAKLRERTEHFASYSWRVGSEPDCTATVTGRFPWGGMELRLKLSGGRISAVTVYTDSMEADLSAVLTGRLTGAELSLLGIKRALSPVAGQSAPLTAMVADTEKLMEEWQYG